MVLTRRAFAGVWVASIGVGVLPLAKLAPARAQHAAEEEVRFRWRVPTAHYQTVESNLRFQGTVEQERDAKGPPVFVFIGLAWLPSLADDILTLRRKLVQPGIKIDARGTEIKIEVDPTLPRGMILLVDASGAKLYGPEEITDPADLAKAIIGAKSK